MSGSHDVVIVQPLLPPVRNPVDVRAGPKRGEEKGPGFSRSHVVEFHRFLILLIYCNNCTLISSSFRCSYLSFPDV